MSDAPSLRHTTRHRLGEVLLSEHFLPVRTSDVIGTGPGGAFVQRSGDTMLGALTLAGTPTDALHAATKAYVDAFQGNYVDAPVTTSTYGRFAGVWNPVLPLTGGTLTGTLELPFGTTAAPALQYGNDATGIWRSGNMMVTQAQGTIVFAAGPTGTQIYAPLNMLNNRIASLADPVSGTDALNLRTADARYEPIGVAGGPFLALAGGTMLGPLALAGDPTSAGEATTRNYVDTQLNTRLALSGGTLTGPLVLPVAPPTLGQHAANKSYVDEQIAEQALYQGTWRVAANTPPLNPPVPAPYHGYMWIAVTASPTVPERAPINMGGLIGVDIYNGDKIIWNDVLVQWDHIRVGGSGGGGGTGNYQGTYRPQTNTPDLTTGTPTGGDYYFIITLTDPERAPPTVPGLNGIDLYNGDQIIWSGTLNQWQRIGRPAGSYLPLTGGRLSGSIVFDENQGIGFDDGGRVYEPVGGGLRLKIATGTTSIDIEQPFPSTATSPIITQATGDLRYLNVTGDTMTGSITFAGATPTLGQHWPAGGAAVYYSDANGLVLRRPTIGTTLDVFIEQGGATPGFSRVVTEATGDARYLAKASAAPGDFMVAPLSLRTDAATIGHLQLHNAAGTTMFGLISGEYDAGNGGILEFRVPDAQAVPQLHDVFRIRRTGAANPISIVELEAGAQIRFSRAGGGNAPRIYEATAAHPTHAGSLILRRPSGAITPNGNQIVIEDAAGANAAAILTTLSGVATDGSSRMTGPLVFNPPNLIGLMWGSTANAQIYYDGPANNMVLRRPAAGGTWVIEDNSGVGDSPILTQTLGDARYLTQTSADALYVNTAGDTMNGPLTMASGIPIMFIGGSAIQELAGVLRFRRNASDQDILIVNNDNSNPSPIITQALGDARYLTSAQADSDYLRLNGSGIMSGALNMGTSIPIIFSTAPQATNMREITGQLRIQPSSDVAAAQPAITLADGANPSPIVTERSGANLYLTRAVANVDYLRTDGSNFMSGPLTLSGDPTQDDHAATRRYVLATATGITQAAADARYLQLSGPAGTPMVGHVRFSPAYGIIFSNSAMVYSDTALRLRCDVTNQAPTIENNAGGNRSAIMTQLSGDARYYTQAQADGRFLQLTGGSLTGAVTTAAGIALTASAPLTFGTGPGANAFQEITGQLRLRPSSDLTATQPAITNAAGTIIKRILTEWDRAPSAVYLLASNVTLPWNNPTNVFDVTYSIPRGGNSRIKVTIDAKTAGPPSNINQFRLYASIDGGVTFIQDQRRFAYAVEGNDGFQTAFFLDVTGTAPRVVLRMDMNNTVGAVPFELVATPAVRQTRFIIEDLGPR